MKSPTDILPAKHSLRYHGITVFGGLLGIALLAKASHSAGYWSQYVADMRGQAFDGDLATTIAVLNMGAQFGVGTLLAMGLFWPGTRTGSVVLGLVLLSTYTVYSHLAALGAFSRPPCSCIGWWAGIGWETLLAINAVLLFGLALCTIHVLKERGVKRRK